jgi:hypothetical protein
MEVATFKAVGDRAEAGNIDARLYWMAIARLTCTVDSDKSPEDVHVSLLKTVGEVYTGQPLV